MLTEADGEEEGALELHSELQPALRLRLHTHRTAPGDDRPAPTEFDAQESTCQDQRVLKHGARVRYLAPDIRAVAAGALFWPWVEVRQTDDRTVRRVDGLGPAERLVEVRREIRVWSMRPLSARRQMQAHMIATGGRLTKRFADALRQTKSDSPVSDCRMQTRWEGIRSHRGEEASLLE